MSHDTSMSQNIESSIKFGFFSFIHFNQSYHVSSPNSHIKFILRYIKATLNSMKLNVLCIYFMGYTTASVYSSLEFLRKKQFILFKIAL